MTILTRFAFILVLVSTWLVVGSAIVPCNAQGISEMGGVYAMPKPMPNANVMKNTLNRLYTPGQVLPSTDSNQVDADGKPLDPRVQVAIYGKQANTLYEQAREKERAGNILEAIKLYGQSLSIRQRIWGDKDPNTAKIYFTIGQLHRKQKKLEDAENCFRRSLAIINKRNGPGSPETIVQINALADVLNDESKYSQASSFYKQLLTLKERQLGAEHDDTAATRMKLIEVLINAGSLEDAEGYIKKALALREKAGDSNSPQLAKALEYHSRVLRGMGRAAAADEIDYRLKQIGNTQQQSEVLRGAMPSEAPMRAEKARDEAAGALKKGIGNTQQQSDVSLRGAMPNVQAPIPGTVEPSKQQSPVNSAQTESSITPSPESLSRQNVLKDTDKK